MISYFHFDFIIYTLNYTAASHSMRWKERKEREEGRKLALESLGYLHPPPLVRRSLQCCPYPSSEIRPWDTGVSWVLVLTAPESPGLPQVASSQVLGVSVKASAAKRKVNSRW